MIEINIDVNDNNKDWYKLMLLSLRSNSQIQIYI